MSEELVITPNNPFVQESWSENAPVIVEEKLAETINKETLVVKEEPPKKEVSEEIIKDTPNEPVIEPFYKKIGFEKEEDVINEINTLREKASKMPDEIKFADDQSKKIHELLREGKPENKKAIREFLQTQEQIEEISSLQINKENAEEVIKLQIKLKNPQLSPADVEFEYKQNYGIPREPVQRTTEENTDFEERHGEWKERVESIERRREIAAKMAQPELIKLKTELVLPDIQKEVNQTNQPQIQEELDRVKGIRENFLSKLESDFKNFNGYEIKYKDEEVEIPVSFAIDDDEKIALKTELENFDVDGFIGDRWFNKDGSPNVTQMMDDVTLLRNKEKVLQKVANEVGAQMKLHYMGKKSNVNVNGSQETKFTPDGTKSKQEQEIDFIMTQKY